MKAVLALGTTERPFVQDIAFNISLLIEILLIHRQGVGQYARYVEDLGITAEKKSFYAENYRIFKNWYIGMKSGKKVIEGGNRYK